MIGSIGVRRDPKAVPALVKRLGDSDPRSLRPPRGPWAGSATLEAVEALEKALAKAPEANRLAVCEGLFRCADVLRTQGQRQAARAIYEQLAQCPGAGVCEDRRQACRAIPPAQDPLDGQVRQLLRTARTPVLAVCISGLTDQPAATMPREPPASATD